MSNEFYWADLSFIGREYVGNEEKLGERERMWGRVSVYERERETKREDRGRKREGERDRDERN